MPKRGQFFFFQTGADSRWAWGGTLKQAMEKVIAEIPWHFCLMAGEDDALYFPKPWPKPMDLPHSILGLNRPKVILQGLPDVKAWPRRAQDEYVFHPFSKDIESLQWAQTHVPGCLEHAAAILVSNPGALATGNPTQLRRLNGRSFSLNLEKGLSKDLVGWNCSQGCVVNTVEELGFAMRERRWIQAMLKGENGQSGNANVHVQLEDAKSLELAKGILKRCGRGVLEEWHDIDAEFGFQYELDADGNLRQQRMHRMLATASGHFLGVLIGDSDVMRDTRWMAFQASAMHVASALHDTGYWGHVGQDGYLHREKGIHRFRPLSDLNVRMTMATPAHVLCDRLRQAWHQPDLKLAWLFLPGKYRLSRLDQQQRQAALGDWSFNPQTRTGALWLTPCVDSNGNLVERHSLLLIHRNLSELEEGVRTFRGWAMSSDETGSHEF